MTSPASYAPLIAPNTFCDNIILRYPLFCPNSVKYVHRKIIDNFFGIVQKYIEKVYCIELVCPAPDGRVFARHVPYPIPFTECDFNALKRELHFKRRHGFLLYVPEQTVPSADTLCHSRYL